jgi:sugar fermentation stimulation protein A
MKSRFRAIPAGKLVNAIFIRRINRFLVECSLKGSVKKAFLPNPGRLWELLFPGTPVLLSDDGRSENRRTDYTLVGINVNGTTVMLHTHMANHAVRWLIEQGKIPSLKDYSVIRQEYTVGGSRFDFLLQGKEGKMLLEVKSCTLFGEKIAMFPDAPSERAAKHVRELGDLAGKGADVGVLFLVQSSEPDYFLPDYHTDPSFADELYINRDRLKIIPASVSWDSGLVLADDVTELAVPWTVVEKESADRGCYMVVMRVAEDQYIDTGSLGEIFFREGFYIYVGSARKNLRSRMERHKRKRKRLHWHIDYLLQAARVETVIPVRTAEDLECELARKISALSHWSVPGFGCSDCKCSSHLFGMSSSPFESRDFVNELIDLRINRLEKYL